MSVRVMRPEDMDFVLGLVRREGWTYDSPEIARMLRLDPEGSFVYEEGEPLGVVNTITYGRTGFIGILVVSEKGRGRGIGRILLSNAIEHCESKGAESIYLFATSDGARLYEKHGFRRCHIVHCIEAEVAPELLPGGGAMCRPLRRQELGDVLDIDRVLFGDDRSQLLRALFDEHPDNAFKVEREGEIVGYAMGRRTMLTMDLGPWVCTSGRAEDAEALLSRTLGSLGGHGVVYLGVFDENARAMRLIEPMRKIRSWSTTLMARGRGRYEGHLQDVYGIVGFELG